MVVMALDHVREYFTIARFNPVDPTATSTAYFATRWVTHFVAPTFVFLAGTAAFISRSRGKSGSDLSRFLLTRGLWLVLLELTVVKVAWEFNFSWAETGSGVIWALGWSMVALAALVRLPTWLVGSIGVAMIALHNLTDGIEAASLGALEHAWRFLHTGGPIPLGGITYWIGYPLVPWVGVMAAGYAFGTLVLRSPEDRRRVMFPLGLGMTAAFLVLRFLNVYGDPVPWTAHAEGARTAFAFFNVEKYPPSLLFLLATLGPVIAALPLLEGWRGPVADFFVTFGRVPLFYYVLHIYWIHVLVFVFALALGWPLSSFFNGPWHPTWPRSWGWDLPIVFAVWAGVVLTLFPLCAWFARVKARRKDWWLSYL